jgi:hypothetical protein
MILQLLPSEFLYEENFIFFFISAIKADFHVGFYGSFILCYKPSILDIGFRGDTYFMVYMNCLTAMAT